MTLTPDASSTPVKEGTARGPTISVVVPLKDEEGSIATLVGQILKVGRDANLRIVDIVLVDDGSEDGTWAIAEELANEHAEVSAARLRRNFGKATALMVGVGVAAPSDIVITMDGDLQDDAEELPRFLAAIEAGADLVSGWKQHRHDPLGKTLPSRLFNRVTAWVSGIKIHDFNCGYKAYRREIFDTVRLYGELHRYTPVLANALGYRVAEISVRHHPRKFGQSKYGVTRFVRGFLDLLTVLTITRFAYRPGHLFGGIGALLFGIGSVAIAYLVGLKLLTGAEIGQRPLLLLGSLAFIVGVLLLLFGMLAELIVSHSQGPVGARDLVAKHVAHRVPRG